MFLEPLTTVGLTFAIRRGVSPTLVQIDSTGVGNILINGTIDNPIGVTVIRANGGSVLATRARDVAAGGHVSLIRTNILDLESNLGSVGSAVTRVNVDLVDSTGAPAPTTFRVARASDLNDIIYIGRHTFFDGELVVYNGSHIGGLTPGGYYYVQLDPSGLGIKLATKDAFGVLHTVPLTPDYAFGTTKDTLTPKTRAQVLAESAGQDVYLDLKGLKRIDDVTPYVVVVDLISAGRNVDVLLRSGLKQTTVDPSISVDVLVTWPSHVDDPYNSFFHPDGAVFPASLGAFAIGGTAVATTYDFRGLDTSGNRILTGLIAGNNIIVTKAFGEPAQVNVVAITDTLGGPYPEDGGDQHHVDVHTDGFITIYEQNGDLRVGEILSSANYVILETPRMIVDALNDLGTADVTGTDITMCPGTGRPTNLALSTPSSPQCFADSNPLGGVGTPQNFLETNVDVLNSVVPGVMRVLDYWAAATQGVFIGETVNDLKIHTIRTLGDISARTESGSIVDARNGGAGDGLAKVIGNFIDLQANGGSIGDPSGANDLELDSSRWAASATLNTFNVGLEAIGTTGSSIFVTETPIRWAAPPVRSTSCWRTR